MLSFCLPAVRAKRFVLLCNRETESWGCVVPGSRIPSKSEQSQQLEAEPQCLENTAFSQEHDFMCPHQGQTAPRFLHSGAQLCPRQQVLSLGVVSVLGLQQGHRAAML